MKLYVRSADLACDTQAADFTAHPSSAFCLMRCILQVQICINVALGSPAYSASHPIPSYPISTPFYSIVRRLDSGPLCAYSGFNLHILVVVIFSFPLRVNEAGLNPDGSFFTSHLSTAQVIGAQTYLKNWFGQPMWGLYSAVKKIRGL
jgi:hypothetical protein